MPIYTYTALDDPSAIAGTTVAHGINSAGQIVGQYPSKNAIHGFLYSGGAFTTLDDPSATLNITEAFGINDMGQIVGLYAVTGGIAHGFLYTGGTYTSIDDPLADPTQGTEAIGINNRGQIVGWYRDSMFARHGFLYDPNSGIFPPYFTLNDPLATGDTFAYGINDAGQIVGEYSDASGSHGFLLSAGKYTTLDDPSAGGPLSSTVARGINNKGQIVGSYRDSANHEHGFLYSGGFYITLDDPLATQGTEVFGINDAGQIVGRYVDAGGTHGFLATLGPNPPPPGGTTADMILRASRALSQYEVYDIGSNSILAAYSLGQVGSVSPGFSRVQRATAAGKPSSGSNSGIGVTSHRREVVRVAGPPPQRRRRGWRSGCPGLREN